MYGVRQGGSVGCGADGFQVVCAGPLHIPQTNTPAAFCAALLRHIPRPAPTGDSLQVTSRWTPRDAPRGVCRRRWCAARPLGGHSYPSMPPSTFPAQSAFVCACASHPDGNKHGGLQGQHGGGWWSWDAGWAIIKGHTLLSNQGDGAVGLLWKHVPSQGPSCARPSTKASL